MILKDTPSDLAARALLQSIALAGTHFAGRQYKTAGIHPAWAGDFLSCKHGLMNLPQKKNDLRHGTKLLLNAKIKA